ncbi:MAG: hypothetical protein ACKOSQ_05910 [Planctomycetaceae bacterium]
MPDTIRLLLVSPDLMVSSRIAGLAAGCGATLDTVVAIEATPPASGYHVAILDLQGLRGDAAELVAHARARLATLGPREGTGPALVAFGPHVAVDRLAAARAAGSDDVVSRGELLGAFAAILARHAG